MTDEAQSAAGDLPEWASATLPDGRRAYRVAAARGVTDTVFRERLAAGWPLDRATFEPMPRRRAAPKSPRPSLLDTVRLSSGDLAWPVAQAAGVLEATFRTRLARGLSPDQAAAQPVGLSVPKMGRRAKAQGAATGAQSPEGRAQPPEGEAVPEALRGSAPGYAGQVASLDAGWRLVVDPKLRRYVLQRLVGDGDAPRWVRVGWAQPGQLSGLAQRFAAQVPGLADLSSRLPYHPADALPEFTAQVKAGAEHREATAWRRDDYAGELRRDGSLRLVVVPDGSAYRLQWQAKRRLGTGADWLTVCARPTLSEVWAFVHERVGSIIGPGRLGVLLGDDVEPRWRAMVEGLPELPGDVELPGLPAPRSSASVSAQRQ